MTMIGKNIKELATPELVIDLNIVDQNYKTVSEAYQSSHLKMRTHTKNIKSPFLARKLQIGYNRAARIIDMMEADGVVSKANHVGKRDVL